MAEKFRCSRVSDDTIREEIKLKLRFYVMFVTLTQKSYTHLIVTQSQGKKLFYILFYHVVIGTFVHKKESVRRQELDQLQSHKLYWVKSISYHQGKCDDSNYRTIRQLGFSRLRPTPGDGFLRKDAIVRVVKGDRDSGFSLTNYRDVKT